MTKGGYGDMSQAITIRHSNGHDEAELRRLAALDDRRVIEGEAMLAFVDDELRAAVGLDDGRSLADPFQYTAELVDLLKLSVAQERS